MLPEAAAAAAACCQPVSAYCNCVPMTAGLWSCATTGGAPQPL
eukprot:CAMPEP_0180109030 /NCGR_PEP_ID=MMETSP0985-20121206/34233_1 /TAXON_ID=483367 /ORGANISM="non described non described, Strain CCMP 2436" /LENGTH=42 /DNA_ID= /DNA_START= /DNA_END= /DNA_ORIENTATION=